MRNITKTFWGSLAAFVLLSAGSVAQEPAQTAETADPASDESIQAQTQASQGTILYFPDFVDGGGWSVKLALSNVDPDSAAEVVVEVYDEDGGSVVDLFDSGLTLEILPLGSRVLRSSGTGDIRRGWIQVRTSTDSVNGLLIYREGATGIEVSVEPAELGERFALFVEESDDVGAGVAVFKPDVSSSVQFRVRDEEGNDPLDGASVTRGNFHQLARTLPEWFKAEGIDRAFLSDFRGLLLLRTEDESPFASLGLRFGKKIQSLSSVPAIRDEMQEPMETTLYFPDYVDGSGWSVQLALSNIDVETAAQVSVEVFDEDGQAVSDLFEEESRFQIPSLGSRVLASAGAGAIRRGWIEVESDSSAVSGLLTYRQSETGVEVSVKPVVLGSQFALFVEESSAIGAGVAIFKPDASPNVELRIRDEEGNDPLNGVYIPRGDFHQRANTLPEWLAVEGSDAGFLNDFRGLLFLRSEDDSQFAPLGLRFGKTSHSLSSVPAIRIADGDGISGGRAPAPTVALSVAPASIDWGESATLTWSSINAESVKIVPDLGTVSAAGSREVSPRATTTYRVTVRGSDGQTRTASATVTVIISEQAALRALYEFTGGSDWTASANWGTDRTLGEWHGVDVDDHGRIIGLSLDENNLSGPIPPELGALTHLTSLDLSFNKLTGAIPPELGSLVNLTSLDLRFNNLTGTIPPALFTLANLTSLDLSNNELTGPIPLELVKLANLTSLDLSSNELTGPIPLELVKLANLTSLDLSSNELTGTIPPELVKLTHLMSLNLSDNNLTGTIPPVLGTFADLTSLDLSDSYLTGPIPPDLGALTHLTFLDLVDNKLTGPIPPELGALTHLTYLNLAVNDLTGTIPAELGALVNLESVQLSHNKLTGPVPSAFIEMELQEFSFGSNDGLCVPGDPEFLSWSRRIAVFWGPFCNDSDKANLEVLHEVTSGSDWTDSTGWGGDGALGEWYGVSVDSLGRVTALDLSQNGLEGRLPDHVGRLSQMRELRIDGNALTGRLPLSLSTLQFLREFHYADTHLCVPTDEPFRVWLDAISSHAGTRVECAPLPDRDSLVALYDATGGENWIQNENWLTDRPVWEWSGVDADGDGRVIGLSLGFNNLAGTIPPELGELVSLTSLDLSFNKLTGAIPAELGALTHLKHLDLGVNNLTVPIPPELGGLNNLEVLLLGSNSLTGPIPPELGGLTNVRILWFPGNKLTGPIPTELGELSSLETLLLNNNELTGPIPTKLAALTNLETLWLGSNNLTGSIPPELAALNNLKVLLLDSNNLTGPIPTELAALTNLETLQLGSNNLTGPIPPELGELSSLEKLFLNNNELTGPIPPELGALAKLTALDLRKINLTGSIPPELGALTNLEDLVLAGNNLTGPIPTELGALAHLRILWLSDTGLTGPIPPELGGMGSLRWLFLSDNPRMSGELPHGLTDLRRLERFMAENTDLCAPSDARFREWLDGVWIQRVDICDTGDPPPAYLTQAVQSREFPVPLVAGRKALLRVFVSATRATNERLPPVRARFYLDGMETHVAEIAGKSSFIPKEVKESDLDASSNVEIPGWVVQPGLEMVIDVDPEGTLGSNLGVPKRIPETGRLAVDVRTMPVFDLTVIPFLWDQDPDSSILEMVGGMAQAPEDHPLLEATRTLLPIGELDVTAHASVLTSTNNAIALSRETQAIRAMEGANGYFLGMMAGELSGRARGATRIRGLSVFSAPNSFYIAHEFGHNFGLYHAPCGIDNLTVDTWFPETEGSIGASGYDFREGGQLVPPSRADLMSYCYPQWISDYHFSAALRFRLRPVFRDGMSALVAAPARSLLLWGGVDARGAPFLEPAFVVDARAKLPRTTGENEFIGRTADGDELFSLAFEMPEVADGDGRSSFAFILPVQPEWADRLASITLSGPGGSVTVDEETDRPMTILRNPRTGQIRAILRGTEAIPQKMDEAVSILSSDPGLERSTSRGIPDPEDWTQ